MKERLSVLSNQFKERPEQIIQGYSKLVQRLHKRVEDLIVENSVFSKDQVEGLEGMCLAAVLIPLPLLTLGIAMRNPLVLTYGIVSLVAMPGAMALVIASDEVFRANK